MKTLLTTIPFGGFYNSCHSAEIDSAIESDAEYFGISADSIVDHPDFDFVSICTEYAKEYVMCLNGILKTAIGFDPGLEFESLQSPKFYNFDTDRILCHITEDSASRLLDLVKGEYLAKTIRDRFTSHSGFDSHYSNDVFMWMQKPLDQWDHNEIGTIIQSAAEHIVDEFDESSIAEDIRESLYLLLPYDESWEE